MNKPYSSSEPGPGRVPPQALEIEEVVLGSLLLLDDALPVIRAELGSDPDVFYKPAHRHIYRAALDIHDRGHLPDPLAVEERLRDAEKLAGVGGPGCIADLTRSAGVSENLEYYCQILIEKWTKRRMIADTSKTTSRLYQPDADPYDELDKAMTALDGVADRLYRKQGVFVSDMLEGVLAEIAARCDNPGINGVPSGYAVDKYTGGWQPGNFYVIGARPSIGKTAFALNAAFNAALFASERLQTTVYYSNMEMKNHDLIKRRMAVEARVNYLKMRDGNLSEDDLSKLNEAATRLFDTRFILDDTPSPSINEWRAKVKTAVRRHGVGLAVVDYLQLMSGKTGGNREQEIGSISRGLKATAMECNIPVIALSQLSRECERREGAEPYLSDLRESGSLEQDADGVILLNRPEFFNHNLFRGKPTKGKGWIKVAKMRQGMTGDFTMNFHKQYALWVNEAGPAPAGQPPAAPLVTSNDPAPF